MKVKIVLTFFIFLISAVEVSACSCLSFRIEQLVDISDEIFLGKVIKSEDRTYREILDEDDNPLFTSYFEVSKKWKGSNDQIVKIVQPFTSCLALLDVGETEYLVFAYRDNIHADSDREPRIVLTTDLCFTMIKDSGIEQNDIKFYLTRLDEHLPNPIKFRDNQGSIFLGLLAGFVLFLLVSIVFLVLYKKRVNFG